MVRIDLEVSEKEEMHFKVFHLELEASDSDHDDHVFDNADMFPASGVKERIWSAMVFPCFSMVPPWFHPFVRLPDRTRPIPRSAKRDAEPGDQ